MVLCRVFGLPAGFLSILTLVAVALTSFLASADTAEARRRYKRASSYAPPYSALVVDANSGKTLYAVNPDAPRFPASITKVMTLYLLFEQMERGKFTLESNLAVSRNASLQAPSKLGLDPGETISVEDAIKALVTKSANDVAVVVAENVGGSEENFAVMMTRKARALGMSRTTFRNPSGLPNPEQVTTARDLVTLGRAIQDRFPKQYKYFSTNRFEYAGGVHRNHNRLLGRIEGVDGIKTGYTRASGFNLLTSAKLDGRHILAVVIGGRSGRARDAQVASLIENHMESAVARRSVPMVAEAKIDNDDDDERATATAAATVEKKAEPIRVASVPQPLERPKPAVISELPRQKPAAEGTAAAGTPMALKPTGGSTGIRTALAPTVAATTPGSPAMRWMIGPQAAAGSGGDLTQQAARNTRLSRSLEPRLVPPGSVPYTNAISQKATDDGDEQPVPSRAATATSTTTVTPARLEPASLQKSQPVKETAAVKEAVVEKPTSGHTGWVIQLAATDNEGKAKEILSGAKAKNKSLLASAEAFTEKVTKGDATLYRARFAGFEADSDAQAACKALKRSGYGCFAQRI
jgi:D-alanyl-D-alanine carboxypeptidase